MDAYRNTPKAAEHISQSELASILCGQRMERGERAPSSDMISELKKASK